MKKGGAATNLGIWALYMAIASCTPGGERKSTSAPRGAVDASIPTKDAAVDASNASRDAEADAENSAGATYFRREWVITRGNGTLVFEAHGKEPCGPLPEKRPADFTLILEQRGGEPGDWTYYGLSDKVPCHFPWSMPWMDPHPAACKTIESTAFDKLYVELRTLSPHTIRSHRLEGYVSPHRGGWGILWRWGQVECAVSDIWETEVDKRDMQRFDAVQDLVRKAYQEP